MITFFPILLVFLQCMYSNKNDIYSNVYQKLYQAVYKEFKIPKEKLPVSGGLDSSLIAALVKQIKVVTYLEYWF